MYNRQVENPVFPSEGGFDIRWTNKRTVSTSKQAFMGLSYSRVMVRTSTFLAMTTKTQLPYVPFDPIEDNTS